MKNRLSKPARAAGVTLVGFTISMAIASGCNGRLRSPPPETTTATSQALSDQDTGDAGRPLSSNSDIPGATVSAPLQLQVLTTSCDANRREDLFSVVNTGSAPIALSDISIKFWAFDTSARAVLARVSHPGCVSAQGDSDCDSDDALERRFPHRVSGVAATAGQFAPSCGSDTTHQANWEITVANSDQGKLPPGATWTRIGVTLNLDDHAKFRPGTATWFSPCLTGSNYAASGRFAVYFQGNLVFSSATSFGGLSAPDCRLPNHAPIPTPIPSPQPQPPLATATDVPAFLQWAYMSLPSQAADGLSAILAVQGNEPIAQAIVEVLNNDFDLGRNLVAISVLGELRTQTGFQYFTNIVNTPLPDAGPSGRFGTVPEAAVALSMLQSRAIDGLALMMSPAADSVILNVIKTTQANQVLARAVHDCMWVHGNDGRASVAALLDSQHQILLDRIDVVASGSTYNQRLAAFLAQHPDLNPTPPAVPVR